jgi:MFS family permease
MGAAGAGLLLGVAVGAPVGGVLGRSDPILPLWVGCGILLAAAVATRGVLRETPIAGESRPGLGEIARVVRAHALVAIPLAFSFVDRFTVGFFTTTFSLYLKRIHDLPPSRIGLLIAAFMLPFALLSYPFGRFSQRSSRTLVLCGGSLLYGVGTASLTAWAPEALPWFMASLGTTAALLLVPSMLLATELTPESVRSTVMGAFNTAGSLGFIVGPLAGGAVSQWVAARTTWYAGYSAAFVVAGISVVIVAALALVPLHRWERKRPAVPPT